jgi:hypothetical protein
MQMRRAKSPSSSMRVTGWGNFNDNSFYSRSSAETISASNGGIDRVVDLKKNHGYE